MQEGLVKISSSLYESILPLVRTQVESQIKVRDFSKAQVSVSPAEYSSWSEARSELMTEAKRYAHPHTHLALERWPLPPHTNARASAGRSRRSCRRSWARRRTPRRRRRSAPPSARARRRLSTTLTTRSVFYTGTQPQTVHPVFLLEVNCAHSLRIRILSVQPLDVHLMLDVSYNFLSK